MPQGAFDDVVYVNSCAMILHNFLGQFDYSASTVAHLLHPYPYPYPYP